MASVHVHGLGQVGINELFVRVPVGGHICLIVVGTIQHDWPRDYMQEVLRVLGPLGGGRGVGRVNGDSRFQKEDHLRFFAFIMRVRVKLFHLSLVVLLVEAVAWHETAVRAAGRLSAASVRRASDIATAAAAAAAVRRGNTAIAYGVGLVIVVLFMMLLIVRRLARLMQILLVG